MSEVAVKDMILEQYILYKAVRSGQTPLDIAGQIDRNAFYETVYRLHERFMAGEFSLGYMAEQLGIAKTDLYHLLDAMGLKVTNV